MPLPEDQVYLGAKALLKSLGWKVIAGQPPSGSDHHPVVEVKWAERLGKGSRGAYKPDLIAVKDGFTLLVECKSGHDEQDADKLREVIGDSSRVALLHDEFTKRGLWQRHQLDSDPKRFADGLRGALAHSGPVIRLPDLAVLHIHDRFGRGKIYSPTNPDPDFEDSLNHEQS